MAEGMAKAVLLKGTGSWYPEVLGSMEPHHTLTSYNKAPQPDWEWLVCTLPPQKNTLLCYSQEPRHVQSRHLTFLKKGWSCSVRFL